MSVLCGTFRDRLGEYLSDALAADDRRALREHLASCENCGNEVARIEPSVLFARLPAEEVSSEDVLAVLTGVRAGIALAETERKVGRSHGRSRRRLAATSAAAALAAMTIMLPGTDRRPEAVAVAPGVAAPARGFAPAAQKAPTTMFPADATIYDWNPGGTSEEPRVVWIVDRSLDI